MAEFNARGVNVDAALKEIYGKLHNRLLQQFKLQNAFSFQESKADGDAFVEPVLLRHEHGVTYAAPTEDAYNLQAPVAGELKQARVQGAQHVIRLKIGINAVQSSKTSRQAFDNLFDVVIGNGMNSLRKRIEIDCRYGQQSLATVASVSSNTITLTTAQHAPALWAGMEGAIVEFYADSSGVPGATARSGADGTITAVDLENRTITVTDATGVLATDHVVFPTQWTGSAWKSMVGIDTLPLITSPAKIFNIDPATSSLWKPSSYAVGGGELTFAKVNKASTRPIAKGFEGHFILSVHPSTFADLLDDEAALRRHTGMGDRRIETGGSGITFHVAGGTVEIQPTIYQKEGTALLYPKEGPGKYQRIGATDVTMFPLGKRGETFIERVPGVAGYEMILYAKQAMYTPSPGFTTKLTGIVNAA